MIGDTFTYIIRTIEGEYYCGKTVDISRRMDQHRKEKSPHWFSFKKRKDFKVVYTHNEDVERDIKRFGVEKFIRCLRSK